MTSSIDYSLLPTEQNNSASRRIDQVSIKDALRIINREDARVARAVQSALPKIEQAVQITSNSIKKGGRIFFIGAGTSGRLGVLEAAECPPTFNTPPAMVQAFMAGGRSSVFRSKEGAEDQGWEGRKIIRRHAKRNDVVIGIAASGVTPFVKDALNEAKRKNNKTILVTCYAGVSKSWADVIVAVSTGPEVIAGSTRLKAGTATKLVLNAITVATMIQLGKVYGNRMVDLQPRSRKLQSRATRLVSRIGGVSAKMASELLKKSSGNTKTAIVMARLRINFIEAKKKLSQADGHLYRVIGRV